jgi:hypothetical protein
MTHCFRDGWRFEDPFKSSIPGRICTKVSESQSRLAASCIRSTSKLKERMIVYSFYCLTLSHLSRSAKGKYLSFQDLSSSFSRAFNCNEVSR